MYVGATDPYETGWNNWPCKQDLYRVKFAVDEMLKKTSTFAGEQEWLEELEKEIGTIRDPTLQQNVMDLYEQTKEILTVHYQLS